MAVAYQLDPIIKKVSSRFKVSSKDQVLVILNSDRKPVDKKKPFGSYQHYVCFNSTDPQNQALCEGHVSRISNFARDYSIDLGISYQASCSPDNEKKVVATLANGNDPGAVLNGQLDRWITEFAPDHEEDLFADFGRFASLISTYLEDKAMSEIGLSLQVKVGLAKADQLRTERFDRLVIPVRTKDSPMEIELFLSADLPMSSGQEARAALFLTTSPSIEDRLKKWTTNFISLSISLDQVAVDLARVVQPELKQHLENKIAFMGRGLSRLELSTSLKADLFPSIIEEKIPVLCQVEGYTDKIEIVNTITAEPVNRGKVSRAEIKDIKTWCEKHLESITRNLLFGKSLVYVLIDFKDLEKKIKEAMEIEAEEIGYGVQHLLTEPALEIVDLLKPFSLVVDGEYETAVKDFKIEMAIKPRLRFESLEVIKDHIMTDIKKDMERLIRDCVTAFMYTIDPEHFFFDFNTARDEQRPSVQQEIEDLVEKTLIDNYGPQIFNITVTMGNHDIIDKINTLRKADIDFDVEFKTLQAPMKLCYLGAVRVNAVHPEGWNDFRQRNQSADLICKHIQDDLGSRLASKHPDVLAFKDDRTRGAVIHVVHSMIKDSCRDAFGLDVDLVWLKRLPTDSELKEEELTRAKLDADSERISIYISGGVGGEKIQIDALEKELRVLHERRLEILVLEDNELELADLDNKIGKLEALLAGKGNEQVETGIKAIAASSGGLSSNLSGDDMILLLESGKTPKDDSDEEAESASPEAPDE